VLWQKAVLPPRSQAFKMAACQDGTIVLAHGADSNTAETLVSLSKIDQNGNVVWTQPVQTSAAYGSWTPLAVLGPDIVFAVDNADNKSYTLYKANTEGTVSLIKRNPGIGNLRQMIADEDGGLFIAGYTDNTYKTFAAHKLTSDGAEVWRKDIHTDGSYINFSRCPDGGYVFVRSNWLIKTNQDFE
jgi:hypothetical protein